jgi:hypothetical protein
MRKSIYLVAVIAILVSCRSVEKMVKKGDYDKAFIYGTEKLREDDDIMKTDVVAYERAYNYLKNRDLDRINTIKSAPHEHRWSEILRILNDLDRRDKMVDAILPIRSKEGYSARITVDSYINEISAARSNKAKYEIERATIALERARLGNKMEARNAYSFLESVRSYNPRYENINNLLDEAFDLGLERIAVDYDSDMGGIFDDIIRREVRNLNISNWNSTWTRYEFVDNRAEKDYDKYLVIKVDNLDLGIEREYYNNYEKSNTIIDGVKNVVDVYGNIVRDTAGRIVTTPNEIIVRALVSEARREKASRLHGRINVYDSKEGLPIHSVPIDVNYLFEDVASKVTGDRRAINGLNIRRVDGNLARFPSDIEVVNFLARNFYHEASNLARRYT